MSSLDCDRMTIKMTATGVSDRKVVKIIKVTFGTFQNNIFYLSGTIRDGAANHYAEEDDVPNKNVHVGDLFVKDVHEDHDVLEEEARVKTYAPATA